MLSILMALLAGCAAWSAQPLTEQERQSIASAEAFVARNGYTQAGHPTDLPVVNAEVLDPIATPEQLMEWRRGTLSAKAFGIVRAGSDAYYVLFDRLSSEDESAALKDAPDLRDFRAVLVQHMSAVQVVHSVLSYRESDWKANDR